MAFPLVDLVLFFKSIPLHCKARSVLLYNLFFSRKKLLNLKRFFVEFDLCFFPSSNLDFIRIKLKLVKNVIVKEDTFLLELLAHMDYLKTIYIY